MADFSALVRGLDDVEAHLSKVGVFFLAHPNSVNWDEKRITDARHYATMAQPGVHMPG